MRSASGRWRGRSTCRTRSRSPFGSFLLGGAPPPAAWSLKCQAVPGLERLGALGRGTAGFSQVGELVLAGTAGGAASEAVGTQGAAVGEQRGRPRPEQLDLTNDAVAARVPPAAAGVLAEGVTAD